MPDLVVNRCQPAKVEIPKGKLHIRQCYTQFTPAPTHVILDNGGTIVIWTTEGDLVRTLVAFANRNTRGVFYVDYSQKKVFYGARNSEGHRSLWSVNFDGTGHQEIVDTETNSSGSNDHSVTWDPSIERFILSQGNSRWRISPSGGTIEPISITITSVKQISGWEDGEHYFIFDDNSLQGRRYSDNQLVELSNSGTYVRGAVDPVREEVWFGNSVDGLMVAPYSDLTDTEVIDSLSSVQQYSLIRYQRWIYYTASNRVLKRRNLDDRTKVEEIMGANILPTDPSSVWPWWEDDV